MIRGKWKWLLILLSAAYYNGLEGWDLIACLGALMITDVLAYYMFFAEARIAAENKLGVGAATPGETTPQPVVKRFTQFSV